MAGARAIVVGGGGREHALALAIAASPRVAEVVVLPGNAGTELAAGKIENASGPVIEVALERSADLVVVGPEAPLTEGLVDELSARGIAAYGPSRAAARLEGSKAFMKDFAKRHGIPTARHVVVTDERALGEAIASFPEPPVVKADGLCAGKGVVVAASREEAEAAARRMLSGASFGAAGEVVVLEERLLGAEASVHAICDGERAFVLPAAQDHKRIGDGDTGPNTGGMGTYAPAPLVTAALAERVRREIIEPALAGMAAEGTPFRGTLFAGLMVTPAGEPKLLEFNVRFGDPETQVLCAVTDGDWFEALSGAARGRLDPQALRPSSRHAVCIVLAAEGYPGKVTTGDAITGIDAAEQVPGVRVLHAGTRREGERLLTSGGRVLGVTASAPTLAEAHERAYRAAECIRFRGMQLRRDIAARALGA